MYQIEYADLYAFIPPECPILKWEPYDRIDYPTERAAWEMIGQIIDEEAYNNEAGSFVYRVVKKGGDE